MDYDNLKNLSQSGSSDNGNDDQLDFRSTPALSVSVLLSPTISLSVSAVAGGNKNKKKGK